VTNAPILSVYRMPDGSVAGAGGAADALTAVDEEPGCGDIQRGAGASGSGRIHS
jgi:hypothetical protein